MTWDHNGNILVFEWNDDYGAKKGQAFHGKLTDMPDYMPIDNKKEEDQILIIEAKKLSNLSTKTLEMLQNSRIVITDSSSGLVDTIKSLEKLVKDHPKAYENRSWDECFP